MEGATWFDVLKGLWPIASTLAALLATWAAWSMRQLVGTALRELKDEVKSDTEKLEKRMKEEMGGRLNRHEERLQHHELALNSLPNEEDFGKLTRDVSAMSGEMKGMTANLDAIRREAEKSSHQITRIEDFLLKRGNAA